MFSNCTVIPQDELVEIFRTSPIPHLANYAMVVWVDFALDEVNVLLCDYSVRVIPFGWFKPSGTATPDFNDIHIDDYGQTIDLGGYSVATDAIPMSFNPNAPIPSGE